MAMYLTDTYDFLELLAVSPTLRGQGIGKNLVNLLTNGAIRRGVATLTSENKFDVGIAPPVVLEIEYRLEPDISPQECVTRGRRGAFYEGLGFGALRSSQCDRLRYMLPSMQPDVPGTTATAMELMVHPAGAVPDTLEGAGNVGRFIYEQFYDMPWQQ